MSDSPNTSAPAINFTGLLTIVFIVLKLLHKIGWSWWWVLSPMWIGAAGAGLAALVIVIVSWVIG